MRVGGATYQIPMEPSPERKQALAMRWLIENSRKRGEATTWRPASPAS